MPLQLQTENDNLLIVHASGKLTKQDYETFLPKVDQLIQDHRKINILFDLQNFHGWHLAAAWEDAKFGFHHFNDIQRLAIVGEKRWQKLIALFGKPFTRAQVQYFPRAQSAQARHWLNEQPAANTK